MTITIEPKEIAELLELTALKNLATKDDIERLGKCHVGHTEHLNAITKYIEECTRFLSDRINDQKNQISELALQECSSQADSSSSQAPATGQESKDLAEEVISRLAAGLAEHVKRYDTL